MTYLFRQNPWLSESSPTAQQSLDSSSRGSCTVHLLPLSPISSPIPASASLCFSKHLYRVIGQSRVSFQDPCSYQNLSMLRSLYKTVLMYNLWTLFITGFYCFVCFEKRSNPGKPWFPTSCLHLPSARITCTTTPSRFSALYIIPM